MNPRNTAILALVVAALGAFVWFYEIQGGAERAKQEEAGKRLFPGVAVDQIQSIELRTTDGVNARLERAGAEGWKLVAPLATPADRFAADGVASTLAELAPEATFDHARAARELRAHGRTDGALPTPATGSYVLRIGNATPVGGNVYATDAEGKRVCHARDVGGRTRSRRPRSSCATAACSTSTARSVKGIALPERRRAHRARERGGGRRLAHRRARRGQGRRGCGRGAALRSPVPACGRVRRRARRRTRSSGSRSPLARGGADARERRSRSGSQLREGPHTTTAAWCAAPPAACSRSAPRPPRVAAAHARGVSLEAARELRQRGRRALRAALPGAGRRTGHDPRHERRGRLGHHARGDGAGEGQPLDLRAVRPARRRGRRRCHGRRRACRPRARAAARHAQGARQARAEGRRRRRARRAVARRGSGGWPHPRRKRAGEPTVYWLGANVRDQLPISLADWRASFVAKEAPKAEPPPPAAEPAPAPNPSTP